MKTYDLRNAGGGCIDNPALALLDVFARGDEKFQIIVRVEDIPVNILKSVAQSCGYEVESSREEGEILVAVMKRR